MRRCLGLLIWALSAGTTACDQAAGATQATPASRAADQAFLTITLGPVLEVAGTGPGAARRIDGEVEIRNTGASYTVLLLGRIKGGVHVPSRLQLVATGASGQRSTLAWRDAAPPEGDSMPMQVPLPPQAALRLRGSWLAGPTLEPGAWQVAVEYDVTESGWGIGQGHVAPPRRGTVASNAISLVIR